MIISTSWHEEFHGSHFQFGNKHSSLQNVLGSKVVTRSQTSLSLLRFSGSDWHPRKGCMRGYMREDGSLFSGPNCIGKWEFCTRDGPQIESQFNAKCLELLPTSMRLASSPRPYYKCSRRLPDHCTGITELREFSCNTRFKNDAGPIDLAPSSSGWETAVDREQSAAGSYIQQQETTCQDALPCQTLIRFGPSYDATVPNQRDSVQARQK